MKRRHNAARKIQNVVRARHDKKTTAARKIQNVVRARHDKKTTAARFIQKRYMISKAPLILPRGTVNAITNRALGKTVVQAWNMPGNVYYITPNTFKERVKNKKFISPYTRVPGQYRFRRAVFVGNTPKKNNMKNVMNRARKTSNKISNQKSGKNLIPNNRIGTTNWAALQWSPPSATRRSPPSATRRSPPSATRRSPPSATRRSPVSRYVPSPNWNISPIRPTNNNNANRHNATVLGRLRQAATRTGTRRRLNF
jgi:hypothetical protein